MHKERESQRLIACVEERGVSVLAGYSDIKWCITSRIQACSFQKIEPQYREGATVSTRLTWIRWGMKIVYYVVV
jgi:hypothetical protein